METKQLIITIDEDNQGTLVEKQISFLEFHFTSPEFAQSWVDTVIKSRNDTWEIILRKVK